MARYLKRWESPRNEGRNDKGKGGTARQRQLKKRHQMLRKKLQGGADAGDQGKGGRDAKSLPFLLAGALAEVGCLIRNEQGSNSPWKILNLTFQFSLLAALDKYKKGSSVKRDNGAKVGDSIPESGVSH